MKSSLLLGCCAAAAVVPSALAAQVSDTTHVNALGEAQIVTNRATAKTPVAYSNLNRQAIEAVNFGQDIPFLLSTLPGVVATSDAGTGIGYTALRVRGTDASRTNVTVNGIPLNDPESQTVFWVNMGDFASSLQDLQLQRGVGTSTHGAGAFGASLNMVTERAALRPYGELNASAGSFGTLKGTLKAGTGLMNNGWVIDGRLSHIQSDGYRDRAWTRLNSYLVQGTYFRNATMLKLLAFGGKERTYHAWDGISRAQLTTDRTYNPNGEIRPGVYYDDQTDNYFQQHVQALLTHPITPQLKLSAALHYTYGTGYYEEYKAERKLKDYNIPVFSLGGVEQKRADLVREKHMRNHFFGGNWSLHYTRHRWDVVGGMALNHYIGDHFGHVNWVKDAPVQPAAAHRYYDYTGVKTDENFFLRANYACTSAFSVYADAQYRLIAYDIDGTSDKAPLLAVDKTFHFFNPKVGFVWHAARAHRVFGSLSRGQREPANNSYTEAFGDHEPRTEGLWDWELGYRFTHPQWEVGVGGYWMDYSDQFVPNGRYNEIGEAVLENVDRSFRRGVELEAVWRPAALFRWEANVALSENKVKDYVAYLYDEDGAEHRLPMGTTTLAFSPSVTAANRLVFTHRGWQAALTTQYVGRQYLDNMEMRDNALDAYCVSHLTLGYTFRPSFVREVGLTATVYNLFNEKYETNGYSMTAMDKTSGKLTSDPRFYPMAGTNFLVQLSVKF